jgi:hypothetical protein
MWKSSGGKHQRRAFAGAAHQAAQRQGGETMAIAASSATRPMQEQVCAENNQILFDYHIPEAERPDF